MSDLLFTAHVVRPSYNCQNPPRHQTGWVLKIHAHVQGDNNPYTVGEEISWHESCFKYANVTPGDSVLVRYFDKDWWFDGKRFEPGFYIQKT